MIAWRPIAPWLQQQRRARASRVMLALLLVGLPFGLAACSLPNAPRVHVAASIGTIDLATRAHDDAYSYRPALGNCAYIADTKRSVSPGMILVGWDNYYDPGTDPFPCIHKLDYAYRGGIHFDLAQFQNIPGIIIEKATLSWTIHTADVRDAAGNPAGSNAADCVGALMESERDIFSTSGFLPGIPYQPNQGDVTGLVQSWVMNGDPNLGFVLVGKNESYNRDNSACVDTISDPTLTISYSRTA